uniref:Uncharacterized protein n=1 Tax=Rhodococcus hoagii TaxID=43767 RepID=Q93QI5_RHOHA|nr:unknown [Prescottella equi]
MCYREPTARASASFLIRARVAFIPTIMSASKDSAPPRTVLIRNCDTWLVPVGASRRSTTRVPVSVGSRVYDQMVRFSLTRNAMALLGSKRTTLDVVGHTRKPLRLMLNVLVPSRTSPDTRILRHCGLHSPIRLRSDTIVHTSCGVAAISMLASRVFVTVGSPVSG